MVSLSRVITYNLCVAGGFFCMTTCLVASKPASFSRFWWATRAGLRCQLGVSRHQQIRVRLRSAYHIISVWAGSNPARVSGDKQLRVARSNPGFLLGGCLFNPSSLLHIIASCVGSAWLIRRSNETPRKEVGRALEAQRATPITCLRSTLILLADGGHTVPAKWIQMW